MSPALAHSRPSRNAAAVLPPFSTRSPLPTISHQPYSAPSIARCACGGSCPRCKAKSGTVGAVELSQPSDPQEREADRIADQVMRMTEVGSVGSVHTSIERKGSEREGRSGRKVQRRSSNLSVPSTSHLSSFSSAASPLINDVLRSPGHPLDAATRAFMEPRFGNDFSQVRIHTDERATKSAEAVNALAYTVGRNIVFGRGNYVPEIGAGKRLLAHELAHVIQRKPSGFALMRKPDKPLERRTYIIIYGSGQLNPKTNEHNQGNQEGGGNFYLAAKTKRDKLIASLGVEASKHNVVFGYAPTEAEVKSFLNAKYDAPVAEIHIFSHGWPGGVNLGGPNPTGPRPKTESAQEQEQRWLQKDDLSEFDVNFAENAQVTFYGCNIGNAGDAANNMPFAQEFSNAYGIPVTASTTYSHFERGGGTFQVPDKPGKMETFTPQRASIDAEIQKLIEAVKEFSNAKVNRPATRIAANNIWNRIYGTAEVHQALAMKYDERIAALRPMMQKQRAVVERFIQFLPEPDKSKYTEVLPKIGALINFLDLAYPD